MATNPSDGIDLDALRAELTALPGVDEVIADTATRKICILLRSNVHAEAMVQRVTRMADGFDVHVGFAPEYRERQRVRFVELRREVLPDQQVMFNLTLEWAGEEHRASATGEQGESMELRTAATAALDAIRGLVPDEMGIRLAGVKQIRAFDADLVVVSLYRPGATPQNLVGAVVAGLDTPRSAVLAVLTALNRILGNYLLLH